MRLPLIKGSRARQAARRRVVRHVARYLAVRLEHSDEGEDLQLALLLRRHLRDVAAVREERVLALDDAKALHAVAEERGHRDAAVLDLGVSKEPSVWSLSNDQNDMPEQPTASQKPGLRSSDEPSARSISSSRADQVATDERATDTDTATKAAHVATTNVPAIARDRGPTARPRSAPGSLGSNRLTKICKQASVSKKAHGCHAVSHFLALKKYMHVRTKDRRRKNSRSFEPRSSFSLHPGRAMAR